jgi:hypothetical protein
MCCRNRFCAKKPNCSDSCSARSPLSEKLLWYAKLEGPLYADASSWRAAYRLVDSFRQGQPARLRSHLALDEAFVLAATPLQDMHRFLPTAFAAIDFRNLASDAAAQTARFASEQSSQVEELPEPYGKWLQLKQQSPKWDRPAQLRVEVECRLRAYGPRGCVLSLVVSTYAPRIFEVLLDQFAGFTGENLKAPRFPLKLADPRFAWLTRADRAAT